VSLVSRSIFLQITFNEFVINKLRVGLARSIGNVEEKKKVTDSN
jgi:hypothetical protein